MWGHVWAIAGLVGVTLLAFWPVLRNDFVNWDDPTVIVQNPQLTRPHLLAWAFTTTVIGHYQPLAWLAWSALARAFGVRPDVFHAASLLAHLLNGILIYAIAWQLTSVWVDVRARRIGALAASLAFAVHPVRVEAVAWASALPYVLSTAALLLAFLAYVGRGFQPRLAALKGPRYVLAIAAYGVSLLIRPAAIAIESRAREIASVEDVGIGARVTMAVAAPFVYLGRTVWPVGLSPLYPLPIAPTVAWLPLGLGAAALLAAGVLAWRGRARWPAFAVGSIAYVLLLAPVVGLTPSGQQATADRYMYLPGVVVALLVGVAVGRAMNRSALASAAHRLPIAAAVPAIAIIAALCLITWRQTRWWHDSIALWTRAADLDPQNDIATYNLAIALAEAGRDEEAILRYEQTLSIVPDQTLARDNLVALQARRAERDGDRLADAGRLDEAARAYSRALALDARRLHARAARGITLSRAGRTSEALADLRAAYEVNADDAAVVNALAFTLTETGRFADAAIVLKRGVDRYPDDVNLAHNLARLLATAPEAQVRDGALALRLALTVRDRTGGNDPRVLDTLAAAYAATGRVDLARETADGAIVRAREAGDAELAAEIAAHARSYARRR